MAVASRGAGGEWGHSCGGRRNDDRDGVVVDPALLGRTIGAAASGRTTLRTLPSLEGLRRVCCSACPRSSIIAVRREPWSGSGRRPRPHEHLVLSILLVLESGDDVVQRLGLVADGARRFCGEAHLTHRSPARYRHRRGAHRSWAKRTVPGKHGLFHRRTSGGDGGFFALITPWVLSSFL